jgi:hypothetical protein
MSDDNKIRVIRQLHSHYIETSCLMKVQVKLTVFIPKGVRFYIYPFRKYLPNLEVITQGGMQLIVLPYQEYFKDDTNIRQLASNTIEGVTEDELKDADNFALILLPELDSDYYEQLVLSWHESIEKRRQRKNLISFSVPIEKEFPPMGESSLYIEMRVSQKYDIMDKPKIYKLKNEVWGLEEKKERPFFDSVHENEYEKVLADKKDNIVRFPRNFNTKLQIAYLVGVPNIIRSWLWLGLAIGLLIMSLLYFNPFNNTTITFAIGLAAIAYFAGLRIVVLHDSELLKWWNLVNIVFMLGIVLLLIRVGLSSL